MSEYTGFWIRFLAFIIDTVFLHIIATTGLVFGWDFYSFFGVISCIYEIVLTGSKWQGTIGKRVLSCHVTRQDGSRITYMRSTVRFFAKIVSALPLFLGFLWIAFDKKKRGFHDMLVKSYVVYDKK